MATIKLDWTPNVAINNYEFGYPATVQHYAWQSDKTMGADWYWIRNATARYMPAPAAIHMLIDTVSKNGNLLLNVPLTPDGELEPETISMLTEMGKCLDIIGEAVFSTRCWVVADDGGGGIRFTRNKANSTLYVLNLGWSNDVLRSPDARLLADRPDHADRRVAAGGAGQPAIPPGRRGTVDHRTQVALPLARVRVQTDVQQPDPVAQAITHPNSRAGLIGANLRTLVAPAALPSCSGPGFQARRLPRGGRGRMTCETYSSLATPSTRQCSNGWSSEPCVLGPANQ